MQFDEFFLGGGSFNMKYLKLKTTTRNLFLSYLIMEFFSLFSASYEINVSIVASALILTSTRL